MPATVNRTVLSCGMRLALGTSVWSRATKKSRNVWRSWSAVIAVMGTARLLPRGCLSDRNAGLGAPQLGLALAHGGAPLAHRGADVARDARHRPAHPLAQVGRRVAAGRGLDLAGRVPGRPDPG